MEKVGVIIGRFQVPFLHKAHKMLINDVLDKHDKIIVILGIHRRKDDENNPLDFETRRMMLENYVNPRRDKSIVVVGVVDTGHDKDDLWSSRVDAAIRTCTPETGAILYGGRDSFIPHYKGKFPVVTVIEVEGVSGTQLRNAVTAKNTVDFRAGMVYQTNRQYPKVNGIVDVCVWDLHHVDQTNVELKWVLMQREGSDRWGFVGGYIDPEDSSAEAAAAREVTEETSLTDLGRMKYITSSNLPDWRYANSRDAMMSFLYAAKYTMGKAGRVDSEESEVEGIGQVKFISIPSGLEKALEFVNTHIHSNHQYYARFLLTTFFYDDNEQLLTNH